MFYPFFKLNAHIVLNLCYLFLVINLSFFFFLKVEVCYFSDLMSVWTVKFIFKL